MVVLEARHLQVLNLSVMLEAILCLTALYQLVDLADQGRVVDMEQTDMEKVDTVGKVVAISLVGLVDKVLARLNPITDITIVLLQVDLAHTLILMALVANPM
jgi:hypothetical protein